MQCGARKCVWCVGVQSLFSLVLLRFSKGMLAQRAVRRDLRPPSLHTTDASFVVIRFVIPPSGTAKKNSPRGGEKKCCATLPWHSVRVCCLDTTVRLAVFGKKDVRPSFRGMAVCSASVTYLQVPLLFTFLLVGLSLIPLSFPHNFSLASRLSGREEDRSV